MIQKKVSELGKMSKSFSSIYEDNKEIDEIKSKKLRQPEKAKSSKSHNEMITEIDDDIDISFSISAKQNRIKSSQKKENSCKHSETINENGVDICINCGDALYNKISHEAEYRFYGDNDNQHSFDPSRVQRIRNQDKGIKKDLEKLGLSQEIISIADKHYAKVTNGEIRRGDIRKGIIFACVFQAYKDINNPKTPEQLKDVFNIDRKNISQGINYFKMRMPKEDLKVQYITAEHFIPQILGKFNIKNEHTTNILEIYKYLERKSNVIDKRNPQSVSCGLVYYYLRRLNVDITPAKFGELVGLSAITITNITNEIEEIMYTQE
jgi:transcription initiation factor TFIIIB Brf1 subunit/transcription initiation factor TFIIB